MKVMLLMGGTCVKVWVTNGWYLCEGASDGGPLQVWEDDER